MALAVVVIAAMLAACQQDYSYFPSEDIYSRRIFDHVLAGPESVTSATVYIEPTPGLLADEQKRDAGGIANGYAGTFTSTDDSGRFAQIDGPIVYDVTIRKGLDVGVFRNVDRRSYDIPFLPDVPATGFSSILSASTAPAPIEGHSVAYFLASVAGSNDAKSLVNGLGDVGPSGSLVATYAQYTSHVTLWAIEYETATGLTKPTSKGSLDLTLTNGVALAPVVTMTKIPDSDVLRPGTTLNRVVSFALSDTPPPGFVFDDAQVWINFGQRRDSRPIGHVKIGAELPIAIAFGAGYAVRITAKRADGAKLDSGLFGFGVYLPVDDTTHATAPVIVPIPVATPVTTFDGARSFTATFARSAGLVEHVLVPQAAGGTRARILTPDAVATLDDVTRLGVAQPAGTYTWTTSYYPTMTSTVAFAGADIRYIIPVSTTAPQTIVLK